VNRRIQQFRRGIRVLTIVARCSGVAAFCACSMLRGPRVIFDAPGIEWLCSREEGAGASLAGAILDWARREASDSATGARFRAEYGIADRSEISIVRDPSLCAQAGRAYVRDDSPLAPRNEVALVRVGQRYITINLNAIRLAGEFMLEAVLDSKFHFIEWIGT